MKVVVVNERQSQRIHAKTSNIGKIRRSNNQDDFFLRRSLAPIQDDHLPRGTPIRALPPFAKGLYYKTNHLDQTACIERCFGTCIERHGEARELNYNLYCCRPSVMPWSAPKSELIDDSALEKERF